MNRIWIYVVAVVLLLVLFVSVLVYQHSAAVSGNNGSTGGSGPFLPVYTSSSSQTFVGSGGTSVASTQNGTNPVRDFLKDPDVVAVTPLSRGEATSSIYYSLGSLPYEIVQSIATSSNQAIPTSLDRGYEITYVPDTGVFSVFIYKEPIGDMRREAQDDLAARLGVDPANLCDTVHFVWVSPLANQLYAAKNIGFAGCPGATVLPGD